MGLFDNITNRFASPDPLPPEMEGEDDPFAFDDTDEPIEEDGDDSVAVLKKVTPDG